MTRHDREPPHCPTCHCGSPDPELASVLADLTTVFQALGKDPETGWWCFCDPARVKGLDNAFDRLHRLTEEARK